MPEELMQGNWPWKTRHCMSKYDRQRRMQWTFWAFLKNKMCRKTNRLANH